MSRGRGIWIVLLVLAIAILLNRVLPEMHGVRDALTLLLAIASPVIAEKILS